MQCVITEATEIIEVILAVVGKYEADAARLAGDIVKHDKQRYEHQSQFNTQTLQSRGSSQASIQ